MNVLITGGTGLIGKRLTEKLLEMGFTVSHLSRSPSDSKMVKTYLWNIDKQEIDDKAIAEADFLIHLAGAGVADQRWSPARKTEIINSRTKSLELIAGRLSKIPHKIRAFSSASGIAYYGIDTKNEKISEQHSAGSDFLAKVSVDWEKAADLIQHAGIRTTKLRTGIVLTKEGGALGKMTMPVRLGIGAPLGSGQQFQSWIHIDDLCEMYIKSLLDEKMCGAYNAVAPNPVTNAELTKIAAEVLKKPLWLPNIPAWVLKLIFGEMSEIILGSSYILNQRIEQETDFIYQYSDVKSALQALTGK